jgi:drug/metabolite transporter (DMT)-like permease
LTDSMSGISRRSDGLVVDLAMIAVVLMWSSTFTLFKIAWHDIDPVAFTSIRFAAMVVLSLALLFLSRDRVAIRRQDLGLIVASGLTGYFLYQMGFVLGLDRTTAVASGVLIATHPIWSVVFLWLLGSDRPRGVEVAGVLIGFLGVAVFLHVWQAVGHATVGDLLSLGAAAAFGAYGVITRPLARRYPSRELMASSLAVGGTLVALVGVPAMVRQDWTAVGWPAWLILIYAVVGPVYIAYALWNWAIARRGVPRTVVFGFLTPVVGGALAVGVLGEHVGVAEVLGTILVVAGLVVTRFGGTRSAESAEPVPAESPEVATA